MAGEKIVKDIVHGYIAIPKEYFTYIIDTEYFQRLRRIEQSSMRVVYPCGRHDRFIHSIGVYYLGKKALQSFKKNYADARNNFIHDQDLLFLIRNEGYWERKQFNFEIACLLHDIGHAPFSHTTEKFYKRALFKVDDYKENLGKEMDAIYSGCLEEKRCLFLKKWLEKLENQPEIYSILFFEMLKKDISQEDIGEIMGKIMDKKSKTKVHEIMSSILILDKYPNLFRDMAKRLGCYEVEIDYCFIIRCIMGIKYEKGQAIKAEKQVNNIIISLLNGSCLDVDKLDYFQRDVAMSGFNTASIDMERLINAFTVEYKDGEVNLALQGQALSVVQSIIQINNELYTWIYGHHKVVYEHRVINDIIEKMLEDGENEKCRNIFTYRYLVDNLVTDDDLWVEMKEERNRSCNKNEQMIELLRRTPLLKPIWKSTAEFHTRCKKLYEKIPSGNQMYLFYIHDLCDDRKNETTISRFIEKKLNVKENLKGYPNIMIEKGKTRDMRRKDWKIRIEIKKKFNDLWEMMEPIQNQDKEEMLSQNTNPNTIYFYLYFSDEALKALDKYKEENIGKDIADILIEFVDEHKQSVY